VPSTITYVCSDLFAVNEFDQLTLSEIRVGGFRALRVDNVYARPHELRRVLLSSPTSIWKGDWRDQRSTSRNFADYYDCRTHISCGHVSNDLPPIHDLFLRLVGMYFGVPVHGLTSSADTWHHGGDFNLFRFRRPRRRQRNGGLEQSFPHRDTDERAPQPHDVNAFAAVLYLNTEAEASGGTRFYDGEFELDAGADVGQDGEEDIETLVDTSDAKVRAEPYAQHTRGMAHTPCARARHGAHPPRPSRCVLSAARHAGARGGAHALQQPSALPRQRACTPP
jgi:hypothetical protein